MFDKLKTKLSKRKEKVAKEECTEQEKAYISSFISQMQYSDEVKRYMKMNRERFWEELADVCKRTSGRVSYDDMKIVLGREWPKPSWIDDEKKQMQAFFVELGMLFRADENHFFFP